MAEGFLKGLWGKEASEGTGLMGMWGTVKDAPSSIFETITSPIGVMKTVVTGVVILLIYVGYKRMK